MISEIVLCVTLAAGALVLYMSIVWDILRFIEQPKDKYDKFAKLQIVLWITALVLTVIAISVM